MCPSASGLGNFGGGSAERVELQLSERRGNWTELSYPFVGEPAHRRVRRCLSLRVRFLQNQFRDQVLGFRVSFKTLYPKP